MAFSIPPWSHDVCLDTSTTCTRSVPGLAGSNPEVRPAANPEINRAAFCRTALSYVPGGVDLSDLPALGGQIPG